MYTITLKCKGLRYQLAWVLEEASDNGYSYTIEYDSASVPMF